MTSMFNSIIKAPIWLIAFVVVGLVTPQFSAGQATRNDLGYINLDTFGGWSDVLGMEPKIDVSVEGALMKLVAEASRLEDPELAELLLGLKGVYVRGYETSKQQMGRARTHANQLGSKLIDAGWSSVIRVRNETEHVQMFTRLKGDLVTGMVVLSIDQSAGETMFVNIVGQIDPAQIGRIGQKFNIGNVPKFN